jgi:hypothetical protein
MLATSHSHLSITPQPPQCFLSLTDFPRVNAQKDPNVFYHLQTATHVTTSVFYHLQKRRGEGPPGTPISRSARFIQAKPEGLFMRFALHHLEQRRQLPLNVGPEILPD